MTTALNHHHEHQTADTSLPYAVHSPWTLILRERALDILAAVGAICLALTALGVFFNVTPLILTSGSMHPTMPTGALALARTVPAETLNVGDVVSVHDPSGARVTHRIVAVSHVRNGSTQLTLRGDANDVDDATPYYVRDADRVFFSVPHVGRVITTLNSPPVFFVVGVLCGMFLITAFRPRDTQRIYHAEKFETTQ